MIHCNSYSIAPRTPYCTVTGRNLHQPTHIKVGEHSSDSPSLLWQSHPQQPPLCSSVPFQSLLPPAQDFYASDHVSCGRGRFFRSFLRSTLPMCLNNVLITYRRLKAAAGPSPKRRPLFPGGANRRTEIIL